MSYNVFELFGNAGCTIDPETGEMINYTWREAVAQCNDLQDGRIIDFENGKIYNPDKKDKLRWREPRKKEWRVYYLPVGYEEDENNPEPTYRTEEFFEWLKEHEDTIPYTLKEFQAEFNSDDISDQSYILIEEIEI